jgi:hypothetical protein
MYDERTPSLREVGDYPHEEKAFRAQAQQDNVMGGYSSIGLDKPP